MASRQIHLFSLQLEFCTSDGFLEFIGRLIAHLLVDSLGGFLRVLLVARCDGREFQSQGELEVSLGSDLRLFGVELCLVS